MQSPNKIVSLIIGVTIAVLGVAFGGAPAAAYILCGTMVGVAVGAMYANYYESENKVDDIAFFASIGASVGEAISLFYAKENKALKDLSIKDVVKSALSVSKYIVSKSARCAGGDFESCGDILEAPAKMQACLAESASHNDVSLAGDTDLSEAAA